MKTRSAVLGLLVLGALGGAGWRFWQLTKPQPVVVPEWAKPVKAPPPNLAFLATTARSSTIRASFAGLLKSARSIPLKYLATSMALSPDGRQAVLADVDHSVRVVDLTSGKEIHALSAHTKRVRTLAWSPDGKYLLSAGDDQMAYVWNAKTGEIVGVYQNPYAIYKCAFLPDSHHFVTVYGEFLKFWTVGQDTATAIAEAPAPIDSLYVTARGEVVSGDNSGTLTFWDGLTGEMLARKTRNTENRTPTIWNISSTADGKLLIVDSDTNWLWDRSKDAMTHSNFRSEGTNQAMIAPVPGTPIVVCSTSSGTAIRIVDLRNWTLIGEAQLGWWVHALAASADGKEVVVDCGATHVGPEGDGKLLVISAETLKTLDAAVWAQRQAAPGKPLLTDMTPKEKAIFDEHDDTPSTQWRWN